MTVADVQVRIDTIRALAAAGDSEAAHSLEDNLRRDVLDAIATGAENAVELAHATLKTSDLAFERWVA